MSGRTNVADFYVLQQKEKNIKAQKPPRFNERKDIRQLCSQSKRNNSCIFVTKSLSVDVMLRWVNEFCEKKRNLL